MGRALDAGSSQRLSNTSFTGFDGQAALTISGWVYRATATKNQLGSSLNGSNAFVIAIWDNGAVYWVTQGGSGTSYALQTLSPTGLHHYCMVYDGGGATNGDRQKGYIDGALQTVAYQGTIDTAMATIGRFDLGYDLNQNVYSTGTYWECAVWQAALTEAEVVALSQYTRPRDVRRQSLILYAPLYGVDSPEPDLSGSGWNLTVTGTPAQADHLGMQTRRRRYSLCAPQGAVTPRAGLFLPHPTRIWRRPA